MHTMFLLTFAVLFPVACLGLLLVLARLEETLDQDVKVTERRPAPAPVRAIAVAAVRQAISEPVVETIPVISIDHADPPLAEAPAVPAIP